jgi:hypothetical protein
MELKLTLLKGLVIVQVGADCELFQISHKLILVGVISPKVMVHLGILIG